MSEREDMARWMNAGAMRGWLFAAIVLWAIVGAGLVVRGLGEVLGVLMGSLGPFLVAGLFVMLVRPLTTRLKDRGMRPGLAALIGIFVIILGLAALSALFAGPVISGAIGFFQTLPDTVTKLIAQVQQGINAYSKLSPTIRTQLDSLLQAAGTWATSVAGNVLTFALNGVSGLFTVGLSLFMGLILTFWFLKDGPRIACGLLAVFPESMRDDIQVIGRSFENSFSGYLVATGINVLVIFVLDGIGFSLIRLPYAWFVAAMIGIVGIIPFVGSILSAIIAIVVGLTVGVQTGIITGVLVFMVDQFVYSFLGPIVAGKVVTLHPVAIILALALGASLGGFIGAVLAMPTAAAIRTIYIFYRDREEAPHHPTAPPKKAAETT